MCESISTDLHDEETDVAQATRTVGKKMYLPSEGGVPIESPFYPGVAPDMANLNQPGGEDLVEFASDLEDSLREHEVEDLVENQLDCSATKEPGNHGPVPEGVLEQVADRLRMIGDEMDGDIRRNRMLGRGRDTGLPLRGLDVIIDLLPGHSTSHKNLAVAGDLAYCETLARDLVHVTVRRVIVAAGNAFARALFYELISNGITCPVNFRIRWSEVKWRRWSVG